MTFSAVAVFDFTATSTGSCRYRDVIFRMAGGMVAEKRATCLYPGCRQGFSRRLRRSPSGASRRPRQHQIVQARQIQRPALQVVDDTPWCADDDLRPRFKPAS